ncbi:MAG TPA: hypothetical protein VEI45_04310 [Mycobacterium sp.]|uniref:hypothetical protein n=1 Tax=Mycobacterium sp. TaxID=1785 RepID=UPI002D304712|nr:hypothetical protein [Mycobacterium sp.]HXY63584.1 hypothetical protein [Mycobacterium sp.]
MSGGGDVSGAEVVEQAVHDLDSRLVLGWVAADFLNNHRSVIVLVFGPGERTHIVPGAVGEHADVHTGGRRHGVCVRIDRAELLHLRRTELRPACGQRLGRVVNALHQLRHGQCIVGVRPCGVGGVGDLPRP